MVFGLAVLAARAAAWGAQTARGATVAKTPLSKWGAQTATTASRKTPWSTIGKTAAVGGTVGAAGLGISSAVGTAQDSIERGGGGLLVVGGLAVVGLILIFMLVRKK